MITLLKGNDFTIQWTITNPEGSQINLSQKSCKVYVRSRINGPFEIPTIFVDSGVITATVPGCALPTGKYFLDLKCTDLSGSTTKCRRTITKEIITITENIDEVSGGDVVIANSKMNDF